MKTSKKDAFLYGTVTVGERGQVVIPAGARQEMDINSGDKLLVFHGRKGNSLTFVKASELSKIVNKMVDHLNVIEKAVAQSKND